MEWNFWGALIRIIICLPIVVVLIYLVIKFGLARNYNRSQGNLKILEQVILTPKATINIIKVGHEYLLIGATEKDITLLKQLDDYPENNIQQSKYSFDDFLKRFIRRNGKNE